ncbi:MAG: hypothetical protein ACFCUG_00255 [Thiotrichales bacterium]
MTPVEIRARLERSDATYLLLAPLRAGRAEFAFFGHFAGNEVIWLATLEIVVDTANARATSFIEIAPAQPTSPGVRNLSIGLRVASIDHATLLKSIIMIKNYKRLREGRHAFGATGTDLST